MSFGEHLKPQHKSLSAMYSGFYSLFSLLRMVLFILFQNNQQFCNIFKLNEKYILNIFSFRFISREAEN